MRVRILGKLWDLTFTREGLRQGDAANCDAPTTPKKKIRIDPKERGERKFELVIHEMLHAADWTKDEDEWVAPVAADIARALWKLGARWVEE